VRIPGEWVHPDQNPSNPWAAENYEGVQESGAGTREHLECMPLEFIQWSNAKLNRRQATLLPTHLRHHNNHNVPLPEAADGTDLLCML
jgi:hypothetical protein